ncbi:MAG: MgtC/SapB family protein [Clostridiales bacterium]|nr:MgtC/SapB family protein [Clostridiales bacterium]
MLTGLTEFLPEVTLTAYDNLEFFIRILLSAVLGALVGLERTKRQKEAGIRTHCIIACAAAVFMILSKYAFVDPADVLGSRGADGARIAAQVVSGISFLGAGVIFKNGNSIRGLTTAAGIWATSAIGMAIGAGMYWVGLITTVIMMVAQVVLHRFPVAGDAAVTQELAVSMADTPELHQALTRLLNDHGGCVTDSALSRDDVHIAMELTVRLAEPITYEEALRFMQEHPGVERLSV